MTHDYIPLPASPDTCTLVKFAPDGEGVADRGHLLGHREIHALNAAISAGRPLLVRGEPGIGKSQLARAAAKVLGRFFLKYTIDSHTEPRDLLWRFDAVKRLAEAQLAGALRESNEIARATLAVERFVAPGPLWWAFDRVDAEQQCQLAGGTPPTSPDGDGWENGSVLLLDEIDKAESEVPNGLLEALGAREFTPMGRATPVRARGRLPLVIITTNEERTLPDAFLRRCLVLYLKLPTEEEALIEHLIARGQVHFKEMNEAVMRKAAEMLVVDRQTAINKRVRPWPGQAEYLDLLRAVDDLANNDPQRQLKLLDEVREYTLQKYAGTDLSE